MTIRRFVLSGVGASLLLLVAVAFIASANDSDPVQSTNVAGDEAPDAGVSAADAERATTPPGLIYRPATDEVKSQRHPMIATALSAAPGAIVCPDFQSVQILFEIYAESWEERAADAMTRGAYQKIDGEPLQPPDPAVYGCVVLKPGSQVMACTTAGLPDVLATLPAGTRIRGVTIPDMLAAPVNSNELAPGSLPLQVQNPSAELARRWARANEWAQSRCGWDTEAMVEACLDQQARIWKGIHPDTVAVPWAEASQ